MKICLLDPGLENHSGEPSSNLGDLIIQEAVKRELGRLFGDSEIIQFSTHSPLGTEESEIIRRCSLVFVGGSNLLSSYMDQYKQWEIALKDVLNLRKAILLGAGWWQYQGDLNRYTKALLKLLLSKKNIHSVRDRYTEEKLKSITLKNIPIGIQNVLNTGCPTMWPLAEIAPHEYPTQKADNVLLMLTDYRPEYELDKRLLALLFKHYKAVYFWRQGRGDATYIQELGFPVNHIDHSLDALDQFIQSGIEFDYIGTRLHGGIRCLCNRKRALVLEVDNRAQEIAKDTHLQTAARDDFAKIESWVAGSAPPQIQLNIAAIEAWRQQFLDMRIA
jgi:hypothetical protein